MIDERSFCACIVCEKMVLAKRWGLSKDISTISASPTTKCPSNASAFGSDQIHTFVVINVVTHVMWLIFIYKNKTENFASSAGSRSIRMHTYPMYVLESVQGMKSRCIMTPHHALVAD